MKKFFVTTILVLVLLSACGPSEAKMAGYLAQAMVAIPTQTAIVQTQIVEKVITSAPRTVERVRIEYRVVTATYTGPTLTPTIKPTQIPVAQMDKRDGTYMIPNEIAPGNWRSSGSGDGCYWEVMDSKGDIIDNYFGDIGSIMHIPANGYYVRIEDCGTWKFLK